MIDKTETEQVCPECDGEGQIYTGTYNDRVVMYDKCKSCKGTGRVRGEAELVGVQKDPIKVKEPDGTIRPFTDEEYKVMLGPNPIEVVIPAGEYCKKGVFIYDGLGFPFSCSLYQEKVPVDPYEGIKKCQACLDRTPVRIRYEGGE